MTDWYKIKKVLVWKDSSDMQWPCPDWFHVPTSTEWESVKTIWTSLWWGGSDWTGFLTILKLPLSWAIEWSSWNISAQWSYWYYWSSSPYGSSKPTYASYLLIGASYILPTYDNPRSSWHSIRPFKNSSVIPTSSWTKLYWTSIESWWIFWNSADWLISLSSNGSTWVTIADKNLWATTVWESWNTLSQNNCWYYYQRWNNYGFPFTWATSTSSTQVNAQNYWPWNYYSWSTFIKWNNDWSSVQNDNLRWWVTQQSWLKEYQVYPWPRTYYYDFTTWSVADFTSKWWDVPSSCSISSSWLTGNSTGWITTEATNVPWLHDALQSAKSIHMEVSWTRTGTWYSRWWLYIKSSIEGITFYSDWAYHDTVQVWPTTLLDSAPVLSAWTYLNKLDVDLLTKKATWNYWWAKIGSGTFSDSDIAQLKNSTNLMIPVTSNSYIRSISITIK